jgi:hypothetical protein
MIPQEGYHFAAAPAASRCLPTGFAGWW